MEKIEWLIDKLKRQHDAAAGAVAMLNTLQLLQQELTAQAQSTPATQRIAVVMPAPQWSSHAADEMDAYETESLRSTDEEKVVFELDPYAEETEEPEEMPADDGDTPEVPTAIPSPLHTTYLPRVEQATVQTSRPVEPILASFVPPSIQATVMPNPAPETDPKSLNDLHERPVPVTFNRHYEPIKDLKKAISINDRYQYINQMFGGDETAFDRTIKTINHFNIYSEAEYWIRREVSTKYSWEESDRLVQQFYDLVSRRFA